MRKRPRSSGNSARLVRGRGSESLRADGGRDRDSQSGRPGTVGDVGAAAVDGDMGGAVDGRGGAGREETDISGGAVVGSW